MQKPGCPSFPSAHHRMHLTPLMAMRSESLRLSGITRTAITHTGRSGRVRAIMGDGRWQARAAREVLTDISRRAGPHRDRHRVPIPPPPDTPGRRLLHTRRIAWNTGGTNVSPSPRPMSTRLKHREFSDTRLGGTFTWACPWTDTPAQWVGKCPIPACTPEHQQVSAHVTCIPAHQPKSQHPAREPHGPREHRRRA